MRRDRVGRRWVAGTAHRLLSLLVIAVLAGCGGPATSAAASGSLPQPGSTAETITLDGASALRWGQGGYGVVLAHGAAFDAASWAPLAERIAAQDATVVAVEDISPEGIGSAVAHLMGERGVAEVALVGGSAGADAIVALAARQPDLPDQLILLSVNQARDGLGPEPKLFIASEDEPVADVSRWLAASATGTDNELLLLPGSAHAQNTFDTDRSEPVTRAILDRLMRFARS